MIDKTHAAGIQSMLAQIRQYEAKAKSSLGGIEEGQQPGLVDGLTQTGRSAPTKSTSFGELVTNTFKSVDDVQRNADRARTAFERGGDIPLTDVVLQMQKASIAFEATLQVRNKIIKAYEDIRNMPV